ncbi:DoxX family membrane protein [Nonomuraea sp. MG754425]|uniref:DoxX family protein n=1 Tax=Nonomuraea sp. MG754425 TaxID=2570319 RepID=UPI001F182864|nr:DoxX family protein [Nonomuraea sp. MG754425]MCF6472599.1 DoxX family membrane protein [Nonomuraea sp. MG754425]
MRAVMWVLQIVVAGVFVVAALGKFAGAEPSASTFAAIGLGDWFRILIGVLEVAGVVGLLVPRLAGLAGLALAGLMAGAVLTEAFVSGGGVVLPLILLVLCLVIAWGRRQNTALLWSAVAGRAS